MACTRVPRYELLVEAARKFPDMDPSSVQACMYLLRAGDEAFRLLGEVVAGFHVSRARFTVLVLLANPPQFQAGTRLPPAELANAVGCTRATMTGLIDTLEKDGLVKREPDPKDRRMFAVSITSQGVATLERILPSNLRCMSSIMSPLSEAERRTLVRLLSKVVAGTEGAAAPNGRREGAGRVEV